MEEDLEAWTEYRPFNPDLYLESLDVDFINDCRCLTDQRSVKFDGELTGVEDYEDELADSESFKTHYHSDKVLGGNWGHIKSTLSYDEAFRN